jgi:hypothetical protein
LPSALLPVCLCGGRLLHNMCTFALPLPLQCRTTSVSSSAPFSPCNAAMVLLYTALVARFTCVFFTFFFFLQRCQHADGTWRSYC